MTSNHIVINGGKAFYEKDDGTMREIGLVAWATAKGSQWKVPCPFNCPKVNHYHGRYEDCPAKSLGSRVSHCEEGRGVGKEIYLIDESYYEATQLLDYMKRKKGVDLKAFLA